MLLKMKVKKTIHNAKVTNIESIARVTKNTLVI